MQRGNRLSCDFGFNLQIAPPLTPRVGRPKLVYEMILQNSPDALMSRERFHEKRSQEFVEIHFSETLGYSLSFLPWDQASIRTR